MKGLPRSKGEGIIYGIFMCLFMVLIMSFLNISIANGGVNGDSLLIFAESFVPIYIIAFVIENVIARPINDFLMKKLYNERANVFARILCNAFFIATTMSILMTIVGGLFAGEGSQVFTNFFSTWPRNFCAAIFCNLLIAGPLSRLILTAIQNRLDKKRARALTSTQDTSTIQGEAVALDTAVTNITTDDLQNISMCDNKVSDAAQPEATKKDTDTKDASIVNTPTPSSTVMQTTINLSNNNANN